MSSAIILLIRRLSVTEDLPVISFLLCSEKHKRKIFLVWFLEVLHIKSLVLSKITLYHYFSNVFHLLRYELLLKINFETLLSN